MNPNSRPPGERRLALAVDVGGTKIKAALIAHDGELLALERRPTPAKSPPETVVVQMLEMYRGLLQRQALSRLGIDGVGVSIAGFITASGLVTATAHLSREWVGYDLRQRLQSELPSEYYFALDTPAPALGEAYFGAGRGYDHFTYLTVSTGIGAGIIAGGRYFTGGFGWAGGLGHVIIDENSPHVCEGCGNHGCLETFAATQGILAAAREALERHPDSLILRLAGGDRQAITPKVVCRAAEQGDPAALAVWQRVGHVLGIGLVNLVNITSTRRIVIGGGISQAGELLLAPARQVVHRRAFPPQHRRVEVVQAQLGDLSGVYGAAAMVFHDIRLNSPEESA